MPQFLKKQSSFIIAQISVQWGNNDFSKTFAVFHKQGFTSIKIYSRLIRTVYTRVLWVYIINLTILEIRLNFLLRFVDRGIEPPRAPGAPGARSAGRRRGRCQLQHAGGVPLSCCGGRGDEDGRRAGLRMLEGWCGLLLQASIAPACGYQSREALAAAP